TLEAFMVSGMETTAGTQEILRGTYLHALNATGYQDESYIFCLASLRTALALRL
ncbi:unnamed protein product, partial [marine sediment metagenome]